MKKTILGVLVAVMLFGGAAVAVAQTDDTTSTTSSEDTFPPRGPRGEMLQEVLDALVADGTLEQSQADAVVSALEEARAERFAAREETRAAMQEAWADGVLTEDELSVLPDGGSHLTDPDGPLAEYWADGQLTQDELDEARESGLGFGGRGRHHHGPEGGPMGFGA